MLIRLAWFQASRYPAKTRFYSPYLNQHSPYAEEKTVIWVK